MISLSQVTHADKSLNISAKENTVLGKLSCRGDRG